MWILLCNTVGSLVAVPCYFWFDSATGTWLRKANNADEACDYLLLITQTHRYGVSVGRMPNTISYLAQGEKSSE